MIVETAGALAGSTATASAIVWAAWRKVAPLLPELRSFLKDWTGGDTGRGVLARLDSVETGLAGLRGELRVDLNGRCPGCPARTGRPAPSPIGGPTGLGA